MKFTVEVVTPIIAGDYLQTAYKENTPTNRRIRTSRVEEYARQMRAGLWKLNSESIKFDTNGVLRDGQHRLNAIILADVPIETVVVRDVDPNMVDLLDSGLARTPADVLVQHDVENAGTIATAAMLQYTWEQGILQNRRGRFHTRLTGFERLEVLANHPGLRNFAGEQQLPRGIRRIIPRGLRCWLMYRTSLVDAEKSEQFWELLISGSNLEADSIIYKLRERLIANLHASNKLPDVMIAALTIKAWGIFVTNDNPRQYLAWRADEAFPSFEGPTKSASYAAAAKKAKPA